jgi:hypothetical protein
MQGLITECGENWEWRRVPVGTKGIDLREIEIQQHLAEVTLSQKFTGAVQSGAEAAFYFLHERKGGSSSGQQMSQ